MRTALLLTVGMAIGLSSQAATVEQVVRAMAPASQASGAALGWPALDRLGVKWQHAGLKQTPVGHTRSGTLQLSGLGNTSVSFQGSRSEPHAASLYLPQAQAIDKSEFTAALKRLLPAAQIKQVRAGCKDEGVVGGTAVYQVALTGQQPAYVMLSSGTSKMGLDTSMDIAAQLSKDWNCGT